MPVSLVSTHRVSDASLRVSDAIILVFLLVLVVPLVEVDVEDEQTASGQTRQ